MSSTNISFGVSLLIGAQSVPLISEVVVGQSASQDGVQNGFLFSLDLTPGDLPPEVNLGDVINFIEQKLGAGAGALQNSSGITALEQVFSSQISGTTFNSSNGAMISLKAFELNSTTSNFLFRISVDVGGADPTQGFIPLPATVASWLSIDNLAISFSATGTS
jgi:hypothetical protein